MPDSDFRLGHTLSRDARQAAREFHAAVWQPAISQVIFFCSNEYDRAELADELNLLFGKTPLIGCTSTAEIGPAGYCNQGLSGVSFSSSSTTTASALLSDLDQFSPGRGQAFALNLFEAIENSHPEASAANTFGFMLIDGLSTREEAVTHAVHAALADLPLCGGSASDGLRFNETWIFHGGAFHRNCALLLLVHTLLPFRIFLTQHFIPGAERMVVTAADAGQRIVHELNGLPAADEYARALGVTAKELTPALFARNPVAVLINGTSYVRSIQQVCNDGSLVFYCAIEEGLVLRIARCGDLTSNLSQAFERIRDEIGPPQLTIGCDCILRHLEISEHALACEVGDLLRINRTAGFTTYGEQYGGVHMNQTFTGIAIGYPEARHD